MTIGYLGPKGTFTDFACQQFMVKEHLTETVDTRPFQSLDHLFDALNNGDVSGIFSPIENSIEGPVNRVLDRLIHYDQTRIERIYEMPIYQSLLSPNPDLAVSDIQHIVSMPHAIAQCYHFIRTHCPNATIHHASSTAGAVSLIDGLNIDPNVTAIIGHAHIVNYFPVHLIQRNTHDDGQNHTQFALITQAPFPPLPPQRPTLGFIAFSTPKDQPGSLLSVLDIFKNANINLTKILSRPEKLAMGSYIFYIEFLSNFATLSTMDLLNQVKSLALYFNHLGDYGYCKLHD
jgi:prephenate dehydratase